MYVSDGESIITACEKLGVTFGCVSGLCCVCMIQILHGSENLSKLSPQEKELNFAKDCRLACQCKITDGVVVFEY